MNNGQSSNSPISRDSIISSAGIPSISDKGMTTHPELNPVENLDLNSPSWAPNSINSQPQELAKPTSELRGAKTMESSNPSNSARRERPFEEPGSNQNQPLGQIIDMEMPPSSYNSKTPASYAEDSINHAAFKTTESLNIEGIKETDVIIDKIRQAKTGEELAASYDLARTAMEDNLAESYNRKLAA